MMSHGLTNLVSLHDLPEKPLLCTFSSAPNARGRGDDTTGSTAGGVSGAPPPMLSAVDGIACGPSAGDALAL